jgi:hypothetical protein
MGETDENKGKEKGRISKLAVISAVLCCSAYAVGAACLTFWARMEAAVLCMGLIALSVMFGTGALLMIFSSKKKLGGARIAGLSMAASVALYFMLGAGIDIGKRLWGAQRSCSSNLVELGRAIYVYMEANDGKYPNPEKWCDLLVEYADVNEVFFICNSAVRRGDSGPCHFAMNPNCGPNSPSDTVLLFESDGGWNEFGGVEKMSFDNHWGRRANVLYNLGSFKSAYSVGLVSPASASELNWKGEVKE